MKHLLKGLKYLTIHNVENKLRKDNDISEMEFFTKKDYFIDLSQLMFTELSAINYLVLFVESECKKKKINNLYVALPTDELTTSERNSTHKDFTEEKKRSILNSRVKSNSFLKNTNFIGAIEEATNPYMVECYFSEKYYFESEFNIDKFSQAFEVIYDLKTNNEYGYRYLYPLEWFKLNDIALNYKIIEKRFENILENSERGLDIMDVQAIKNVVFSELRKNVFEHTSGNDTDKRFLFSMGLISSNAIRKERYIGTIEEEFSEWVLSENISSLVEIYFGDTGGGFYTNKFLDKSKSEQGINDKEKQLKWAYNKWSTSKFDEERRGTKGLYRIQRIVNSYNGIFHILTNANNGGYRKGGLKEEKWIHRNCLHFDGSFIQIKLCPFSAVKKFNFTLQDNREYKKWATWNLGAIKDIATLRGALKQVIVNNECILIVLDIDNLDCSDDEERIEALNDILLEISYHSHPTGVVVYLISTLHEGTIDSSVDSINEYLIRKGPTHLSDSEENEEIFDPIIVISKSRVFWYGGNKEIVRILNEVYQDNFDKRLDEIGSYNSLNERSRISIRLYLENDSKLVHINRANEIELNFTNFDTHFENLIIQYLKTNKKNVDGTIFCTPKLEIVENWVNVESILKDNEYGFSLALYLKSITDIRENNIEIKGLFILIDHKQHYQLALHLANLYGSAKKKIVNIQDEIESNAQRRVRLFPEKSNVVILTSIISSSETIRRLVKYVKRDSAVPTVILSLINSRKYNINELETWDEFTKIKSIYTKHTTESARPLKDKHYYRNKIELFRRTGLRIINPNYNIQTGTDKQGDDVNSELLSHLVMSKSLNYNHIGIGNDRHFTFYVNKARALNAKSVIWKKLSEELDAWKSKNSIKQYRIYVNRDLVCDGPSGFYEFLSGLNPLITLYSTIPSFIEYEKGLNILFIDFGIISGRTINKVLNNFTGLNSLCICLLFNQARREDYSHYLRISQLNNSESLFPSPTNVTVRYLFNLPLNYFDRSNCPICNHIDALDYYKMSQKYMFDFSQDRQIRLKIREREEVREAEYPFDFYLRPPENSKQELSSVLISEMFVLKKLLDNAEVYTDRRIELFRYLFDIVNDLETQLHEANSRLYSTIYYLSNEVHWLQREPLVFNDFRELLTKIGVFVANWNLAELGNILLLSNTDNIPSRNLATRYKYGAISLLRSANKLKFCENIERMLTTSWHGNGFSDNLVQNIFYHTYSIFKNRYNRSKKYFTTINHQFIKIGENKTFQENISALQSNTILFLDAFSDIVLQRSDIDRIKSLNQLVDKYYKAQRNHPIPIESLAHLDIAGKVVPEVFADLKSNETSSVYYINFCRTVEDNVSHWDRVVSYITLMQEITKYFTSQIRNSEVYKTYFWSDLSKKILYGNVTLGNNNEIVDMVHAISRSPISYLGFKEEYDYKINLLDYFFINRNSSIKKFVKSFPCDVEDVLLNTLKPEIPKLQINENLGSKVLIFYPKINFIYALEGIKRNIRERVIQGMSSKDVNCKIEIDIIVRYVRIRINYDLTTKNKRTMGSDEYESSGLSNIKKEVEKFGGDLVWDQLDSGNFELIFKFLFYE